MADVVDTVVAAEAVDVDEVHHQIDNRKRKPHRMMNLNRCNWHNNRMPLVHLHSHLRKLQSGRSDLGWMKCLLLWRDDLRHGRRNLRMPNMEIVDLLEVRPITEARVVPAVRIGEIGRDPAIQGAVIVADTREAEIMVVTIGADLMKLTMR